MIDAIVTVGVGAWVIHKRTQLVACPPIDAQVLVGENSVTVTHLAVGPDKILIRSHVRFENESALDEYVAQGWSREWPE